MVLLPLIKDIEALEARCEAAEDCYKQQKVKKANINDRIVEFQQQLSEIQGQIHRLERLAGSNNG